MSRQVTGRCGLCGRVGVRTTRHHLVPRSREKRAGVKRSDPDKAVVDLCQPCHRTLHALLSTKELYQTYNSVDALLKHPEVRRLVKWVRTKPPHLRVKTRPSKSKKRGRTTAGVHGRGKR